MQKNDSAHSGQGAIYTLAQSRTKKNGKQPIILKGNGSDLTANNYGKRKGKKKMITNALILSMVDIAKVEGRADIQKSLWNTYHCQNTVYTVEERLHTKYCKNRFCTNCLGIRKADIINKYYPVLKEWKDAHFVTLTVKACTKANLNMRVKKCHEGLRLILERCRKRANRGKGNKLMGIRSLECCFNPSAYTYNPHIHLIVPDKVTAETLVFEWLKQWTFKDKSKKPMATKAAQKIIKVRNLENTLVEVIKYGTKVFTDPTNSKKNIRGAKVYARAFYNIIIAMNGMRIFDRFGFDLPKEDKKEPKPARLTIDYEEWMYLPEYNDWHHTQSELTLFGNLPNDIVRQLLEHNIDVVKE